MRVERRQLKFIQKYQANYQEKTKSVLNFLTMLEDDDDVQHVYANLEIDNAKPEKALTA